MNDYWRVPAKHATVCPRCRGYIQIGDWIVQEDRRKKWLHAVCPTFKRMEQSRTDEERAISVTEIKFTVEGGIA